VRCLPLFLALILVVACADNSGDTFDRDKSDVVAMAMGPGDSTVWQLDEAPALVLVEPEPGQVLVVTMANEDGGDARLSAFDEDGRKLASSSTQASMPMLAGSDAILTVDESFDDNVLVAAEALSSGLFRVKVFEVTEAPKFDPSLTNAAIRAVHDELRHREADTAERLSAGHWTEAANGFLLENPDGVGSMPLRDLADARRRLFAINDLRQQLFDEIAAAASLQSGDGVASFCAQAWEAQRHRP
jgi:hypothetical protein